MTRTVDEWRVGGREGVVQGGAPIVYAIILGKIEIFQDVFNRVIMNFCLTYTVLCATNHCI
jgi:hypothetical protein